MSHMTLAGTAIAVLALTSPAFAQSQTSSTQTDQRITLPEVTVVAQKEPAKAQTLPITLTTVNAEAIARMGASSVGEAALGASNLVFTDFSARKLSNARFRGVGSSPMNPGVTTFIDGVPQINANTSSIDLLAVDQIEFVRGPQSALFGRNTLGGLINLSSARPSLTAWTGSVSAPLGDSGTREVRASVSGPLAKTLAIGVAGGRADRDGFSKNAVTGNLLDGRSATFGKAQLMWTPTARWETRLIVSGERARDGDYSLGDLGALRQSPFSVMRDFEGSQHRDIASGTFLARYEGARFSISSTTGLVQWKTQDVTDLDYTPMSLVTRDNSEEATQFTQEVRLASTVATTLSGRTTLSWQLGATMFTQEYEQDAINRFSPFLLSPFLGFPISQHSPKGTLDDSGIGAFGQATVSFNGRIDVAVGARADHETKKASLTTFFDPVIAPPSALNTETTYGNISPNASLTVHVRPGAIVYASAGRGYKAGGFNTASPAGKEAFGEEETWTIEGGTKTTWAAGRVRLNASVFHIDWSDLQLNVPVPTQPGLFYIANVGSATSRGLDVELLARATAGIDVFASAGYTRARFADDKKVPFTPDMTLSAGVQMSRALNSDVTMVGRFEAVRTGEFQYDEANRAGQEAYSLVNARLGIDWRGVTIDGWARNLFDTRYIPVAFAYDTFAPSGFVGEMGRPRTLGVTVGVRF
jgi:iron complex outermembrane receptor protein